MPTSRYYGNLVIMGVILTTVQFSFVLTNFMNKYYEGNIFVIHYLDGLAGILGSLIAHPVFKILKIRWAFISSFSFALLFIILFFLHQEEYLSSDWVNSLGYPESQFESGSQQDREYYKRCVIPFLIFMIKIAYGAVFLNSFQANYNKDVIFPFYKRTTSIGIINFIARAFTIGAPLVAELERPIPAYVLLSINSVALFVCFFLPSSQDEQKADKEKQDRENRLKRSM